MKAMGANYIFVVEFSESPEEIVVGTGMTTNEAIMATDEAVSRASIDNRALTVYFDEVGKLAKFLHEAGWLTPVLRTMSSDEVIIHGFEIKH